MGTWGHQFDQNDAAVDFLMSLAKAPGWEKVESALSGYLASREDYEADMAYAAAEVVAAATGYPARPAGEQMSVEAAAEPYMAFDWPKIVAWAQTDKAGALRFIPMARSVADIMPGDEFLRGDWEDAGGLDGWLGGLHDLKRRLYTNTNDIQED